MFSLLLNTLQIYALELMSSLVRFLPNTLQTGTSTVIVIFLSCQVYAAAYGCGIVKQGPLVSTSPPVGVLCWESLENVSFQLEGCGLFSITER